MSIEFLAIISYPRDLDKDLSNAFQHCDENHPTIVSSISSFVPLSPVVVLLSFVGVCSQGPRLYTNKLLNMQRLMPNEESEKGF